MVTKQRVLVVGATGYLGKFVVTELKSHGYWVRALSRDTRKIEPVRQYIDDLFIGQATQPETLRGICKDIDIVISSLGITRQKDGLTYMDVDYQANVNLLHEALVSGVKKFIYVSVLNGENLRHLKICHAKEMFVERLKKSGMNFCIIRPNGFFSDMTEFYEMAKKGRVYLFGNGQLKVNPIHGADLATVCVDAIEKPDQEIRVGGPETLTHNEIAMAAFDVLGIEPKIVHIPDWVRTAILKLLRTFTGSKTHGPIEFFLTVMAIDMIAPEHGNHTLIKYFRDLIDMSA